MDRAITKALNGHIGLKFSRVGIKSSIDDECLVVTGEIKGIRTDGYNLKSGGWSRCADSDGSSEVAYFVLIRKKYCKKTSVFNCNRVKYVELSRG